jgi:tRNA G18 (ribose-2'-O)-methylase SpoU
MSKDKVKTVPDLGATSPSHQAALAAGTEHYKLWHRNVADHFKEMSEEAIKAQLQATAHPFAVLMENLIGDFNFGTLIRNANAFNAKEVFYIGDKKFDKRGAQGTYHYTDVKWLSTIEELLLLKEQYVFIGVDNIDGAVSISTYNWPANSLLIFGSEGVGLTPQMQAMCDKLVYIEQFGSVRSLNVGTASGIIMHDFVSKLRANNL